MSAISLAFQELFFGAGAWLGLLLLLAIIIALSLATKYAGLLMLPVCIFIAIEYLGYPALMWNALIMFIGAVFILINLIKGRD